MSSPVPWRAYQRPPDEQRLSALRKDSRRLAEAHCTCGRMVAEIRAGGAQRLLIIPNGRDGSRRNVVAAMREAAQADIDYAAPWSSEAFTEAVHEAGRQKMARADRIEAGEEPPTVPPRVVDLAILVASGSRGLNEEPATCGTCSRQYRVLVDLDCPDAIELSDAP